MADIFLSNTIKENLEYGRLYDAVIKSRNDILGEGRVEVKIPELLGEDNTVWVRPLLMYGGLTIISIPPENQQIKVFFNGTIEEGYWLGGNIKKGTIQDVDELLIADDKGNFISWHRNTGEFKVKSVGPIELESNSKIKLKAPLIDLDGEVKCKHGVSGLVTNLTQAISTDGIITQIH